MDSVIYRGLARVFHALAVWFDASICGRVFNAVCRFLAKLFRGSAIGGLFQPGLRFGAGWENSLLRKVLMSPVCLCRAIARSVGTKGLALKRSSGVMRIVDHWDLLSVRIYGIVLLSFSVVHAALYSALSGFNVIVRGFDIFFLLAAVFLILVNRSLRSLFNGSAFLRWAGSLFYDIKKEPSRLFLQDRDINGKGSIFAAFLGVSLAALAVFLPLRLFVMLAGGLLGTLLVLRYLDVGIFVVVLGSPFLPTMALAALCLLCVVSFFLRIATDPDFSLQRNSLSVYVIFFAVALIYGALNSFTFVKSAQILLIYLLFVLFYFVMVNTVKTYKKWRALVAGFAMVSLFVALYGILQNFVGVSSTQSWVDSQMFSNIQTRVYSTFDNPNVLGEFLVIMIPTTAALIWGSKKLGHKMFYSFLILCLCACIVLTWSRGSWLGVMLAVIIFFLIMDKRWALAGILGIFILPILLTGDSAIAERLLSIGNTEDTSTAYRVSIWQAAIRLIQDFGISGIGLGSDAFTMVYPKYALAGANYALHSHNLFLQITVEMGVIGIVTFLALAVAFLRQAFSLAVYRERGKSLRATVVLGAAAGIIGFLFQGLTDNVWYNYKMMLIFWLVLGLVSAGTAIRQEEEYSIR